MVNSGAAAESALVELRRQLQQGLALVGAARQGLVSEFGESRASILLDMAEDVLADLTWIDRLDRSGGDAA